MLRVHRVRAIEQVAVDDRSGYGDLLEIFLAVASGDEDLVEVPICARLRGVLSSEWKGDQIRGRSGERKVETHRDSSGDGLRDTGRYTRWNIASDRALGQFGPHTFHARAAPPLRRDGHTAGPNRAFPSNIAARDSA